jgi:hypothetical protein
MFSDSVKNKMNLGPVPNLELGSNLVFCFCSIQTSFSVDRNLNGAKKESNFNLVPKLESSQSLIFFP